MSVSVWLIAEREFRVYVATLSFWVALAIGPLITTLAMVLISGHSAPAQIAIHTDDPRLALSVAHALSDAGHLEGYKYQQAMPAARNRLIIHRRGANEVDLRFSAGFPLSPTGRVLVARSLERDWALERSVAAGIRPDRVLVTADEERALPHQTVQSLVSRLATVTMLWLTLTGSLGMLLQAVVRERVNRSLECLLASVRAWEIMIGKLVGVGAVSLLILSVWLGWAGVLSVLAADKIRLVPTFMADIAQPFVLMRASGIYLLAYIFYGSLTVAIGATARDSASAQNYARPLFTVLLAVYFVTLAGLWGRAPNWLLYVPPFTPFMLLIHEPGQPLSISQTIALALLLSATFFVARAAVSQFRLSTRPIDWSAMRESIAKRAMPSIVRVSSPFP